MLNNINNQIAFNGRFVFHGNKPETADFVRFIKCETAKCSQPDAQISAHELNKSTIVLTGEDCLMAKLASNLKHFVQNNSFLNGEIFYNKLSKKLQPDIIHFDPINATFEKIEAIAENSYTRYNRNLCDYNGVAKYKESNKITFAKRLAIPEVYNFLRGLNEKFLKTTKFHHHTKGYVTDKVFEASSESKLGNILVKEISDAGKHSLTLNIDDKHVIKLSAHPSYPEKFETFDLPKIECNYVSTSNGALYYSVLPKADNWLETRIRRAHITHIMSDIQEKGYKIHDLDYKSPFQVVLHEGKPYLCDYDCAEHIDGSSRLFIAPQKGNK